MIRREHLCNKLHELKYKFKKQGDRVMMYKRPGNPCYAYVPRRELLEEDTARSILSLAGCGAQEIERFVAECRLATSN